MRPLLVVFAVLAAACGTGSADDGAASDDVPTVTDSGVVLQVGIGDVVDAVHPVGLEQTGDPLRVVLVHLTAVRLDNVGLALTAHGGVVHLIGHASEVTDSSTQAVVRSGTESCATC